LAPSFARNGIYVIKAC